MPTYEYICNDCSEPFEIFQSMKDDPIEKCPKCTGTVKRLFSSGAGFIFKGSGFYHTDYKKKEMATSSSPSRNTNSSTCSPACKETKGNENSSPTPTPPSVQQETTPSSKEGVTPIP
ncbi:zinc ribbon domain-containing protein [Candidatus Desantisbacteria bacterium]|nr:zinc ribbon domain-containing protein [Candidatus Desantisbacteria bacterium]